MADLVDRIRKELDARIEQLRPLVGEFERLQRAAAALARTEVRSVPGRGGRPAAPPAAPEARGRAASPAAARPAARTPSSARRGETAGRKPAPRGQTQAKVLAALRAAPGSTTAMVAEAAGIPTNAASATISRLVKQGRVRRLDEGGYALVETPAGPEPTSTAPATGDTAPTTSEAPGGQAPPQPATRPAR
jgi:hypothetical protein